MDGTKPSLDCRSLRRFGAEIEVNAFDLQNRPNNPSELPKGTPEIALIVQQATGNNVRIHKWAYDHNNMVWAIKPDSSCGIEICTPVLKGWSGLMEACKVVDSLGKANISADDRCSFHVHVDVSDLKNNEIAKIITWWVKCEAVFMDAVPASRKRNQYCQLLGQSEIFERVEDEFYNDEALIRRLGLCKYYTINTYHLYNNKRRTLEFRIMDSEACIDPWEAKNWIRLVLHFVERALKSGMPNPYVSGDPWSGYCWLDPKDVFAFLGFDDKFVLSPGLLQVRNWFLERLSIHVQYVFKQGVMSLSVRRISARQIEELEKRFGDDGSPNYYYDSETDEVIDNTDKTIFGEDFRI